ncbi:hypothetical protein CHS0354_012759 [Potamilus streckersoni]|uniref:MACPF domain-containing protein n=1 Tax=Potamilus streckersoni TaxID=2493646 RepID=A0AAE0VJS6_9BIVA|nr:hypothetical protein CHS0354_012759 [Potamilus streckersoni]
MASFDEQVEISLPEIYHVNNHLREENRMLKSWLEKGRPCDTSKETDDKKPIKWKGRLMNTLLVSKFFLVVFIAIALVLVIFHLKDLIGEVTDFQTYSKQAILEKTNDNLQQKKRLSISLREDVSLQECHGPYLKRSFPDMDYALLGYNILKGYPMSIGHDPGFTYPIFRANYSNNDQTADCQYSVPKGLILIPDVSCITSFSSKIVQTQYELQQSLSVSAHISGGGWGVSFSASAGYKEASSTVTSGQWIMIYSSAKCNYYYCKLEKTSPPPFHPVFLNWVHKLNRTISNSYKDDSDTYMAFFDHYGTHFVDEATFGASFTYEHKMSSSSYSKMQEKGTNVAVMASYSGLFSIGAGFNLDSSQREQASVFQSEVQTSTVTIGAPPPANGDTMTWASTVKETPVPTQYSLTPIAELFCSDYMEYLGVRYDEIKLRIEKYKNEYCSYLHKKGLVDTCQDLTEGLILKETALSGTTDVENLDRSRCIKACLERYSCVAISFCRECTTNDYNYNSCQMYTESISITGTKTNGMETTIIISKIKKQLKFSDTAIIGRERIANQTMNVRRMNVHDCLSRCLDDAHCVAFTFCECSNTERNCKLYSEEGINQLETERGTDTYFISNMLQSVYDIYPTSATPTSIPSSGNGTSKDT